MKNLTEKALLVNLKISQWSARRYDAKATEEVNQNHGAKDAGRFNKLLVDKKHLQPIEKAANAARTYHYENTLPWGDNGERLLASANYFEYTKGIAALKSTFDQEVRTFVRNYSAMIDEARQNLNGLFKITDYPNDIRERFEIAAAFMPVPDAQDIRVNLGADEVEQIRATVKAEISDRFASAQRDIFDRVAKQLRYMHSALTETRKTDEGKEVDKIFRDSLFNNVLELADLLPRLNVAEDPAVQQIAEELRSLYRDPEEVRQSKRLRTEKAQQAEEILKKFDAFFTPGT